MILTHKGIKFAARKNTSDEKTFNEVIVKNCYQKKDFKINPGEHWIDLGGNAGAFTLLAISLGCTVDVYEPDPFNCKQIEYNLRLNGFDANIHQKAVVASDQKTMTMYVGNDKQVWRNSLYKDWGNEKFKVDCVNFEAVFSTDSIVKMDIEGAEIPIIKQMTSFPKKMVFEWSLDINQSLTIYREAVNKVKQNYKTVYYSRQFYDLPDDKLPSNISPKADNIYCL